MTRAPLRFIPPEPATVTCPDCAADTPRPVRCSMHDAATALNAFLAAETLPDAGLWANGAVFDIGNLENLMHGVGVQPGWRYNSVRDYRTVSKILPAFRSAARDGSAFIAHDPVSDCRQQIWRLWEHAPDSLIVETGAKGDPESPLVAVDFAGAAFLGATHAVRPEPVQ